MAWAQAGRIVGALFQLVDRASMYLAFTNRLPLLTSVLVSSAVVSLAVDDSSSAFFEIVAKHLAEPDCSILLADSSPSNLFSPRLPVLDITAPDTVLDNTI